MEPKVKTEIKYFVFYKPYNVLNQFTKERPEHVTLADFLKVDKDVYPLGRLDKDSEGLLILTNDRSLNSLLLSPAQHHKRSYFVQLDNELTDQAIAKISKGVEIKLETGDYKTRSCTVKKLQKPPLLPERNPPIRVRQNIPTSWALIELTEGKNRQVRKMFAAVGFPVLRLVRVQIEDLKLGKLEPGKYYEIKADELFKLIKIDPSALIKPKPGVKKFYGPAKSTNSSNRSTSSESKETKKPTKKPFDKPTTAETKETKKATPKSFDKPKFASKATPKAKESEKSIEKRAFDGPKKETKTYKPKSSAPKAKPFNKKEADRNNKSYFKR
jgi:23S rRNA pseudouridine2457 synthase